MGNLVWLIPVVLVALLIWHRWRRPNLDSAAEQAARTGDIKPVVAAIEQRSHRARPAAYNRSIRHLWDSYHRPLAMQLIHQLASRHADSAIAQYWIKQALTVEPQLAKSKLDNSFLEQHYRPEVAARCGPVG